MQIERGLSSRAREVGDETRKGKAAYALGAIGFDLLRLRKGDPKALDESVDRIALEHIVRTYPSG